MHGSHKSHEILSANKHRASQSHTQGFPLMGMHCIMPLNHAKKKIKCNNFGSSIPERMEWLHGSRSTAQSPRSQAIKHKNTQKIRDTATNYKICLP